MTIKNIPFTQTITFIIVRKAFLLQRDDDNYYSSSH
jgi:hypothetical protein